MPTPPARSVHRGGVFGRALDALGEAVVNHRCSPGEVLTTESLSETVGVSRSVMREVFRTLASMGLVESRPNRGTCVLDREEWDFLNPHVIRWRGMGADWKRQQVELLELRLGVEPEAAYLAVTRGDVGDLVLAHAREMERCMEAGDIHGFFVADAEFHRVVLAGSGNAVIAQLSGTVAAVLQAREFEASIENRNPLVAASVERHLELAHAMAEGEAERARGIARQIVQGTLLELGETAPS